MDALDVEMSLAEGERALQALPKFARDRAGTLEAPEAEKGIFQRLLPIGLAAIKKAHDHDLQAHWRFRAHQVRNSPLRSPAQL